MANKTHFKDENGAICGAEGHKFIIGPKDLREVKSDQLAEVTCKRCIKKLREWGFAIQHFQKVINELT